MHLLSTLQTPRYRDARKTCSWPVCSTLARPDFHRQADISFPNAPCSVLLANGRTFDFDAQCDFPLQIERGSMRGFVVRDAVIGLQHQRCRQQAGRHTRSSIVLAVQRREIGVSEQLIPLAGQVAIERPLADKLAIQRVRFEHPRCADRLPSMPVLSLPSELLTLTLLRARSPPEAPPPFPAALLALHRVYETV